MAEQVWLLIRQDGADIRIVGVFANQRAAEDARDVETRGHVPLLDSEHPDASGFIDNPALWRIEQHPLYERTMGGI